MYNSIISATNFEAALIPPPVWQPNTKQKFLPEFYLVFIPRLTADSLLSSRSLAN
jgi:hypothetical protein